MKELTRRLTNEEKDKFLESRGLLVEKSGTTYWDPEMEITYVISPCTIQGLIDWLVKSAHTQGVYEGRRDVQKSLKQTLDIRI